LRALQDRNIKLAVDLLEFEEPVTKAMWYACGDTLVTETLEQVKELAYGKSGLRVKVSFKAQPRDLACRERSCGDEVLGWPAGGGRGRHHDFQIRHHDWPPSPRVFESPPGSWGKFIALSNLKLSH